MIINIRGTHGSGKSSILRHLIERFKLQPLLATTGRKYLGYQGTTRYGVVTIIGSYQTECGGCDQIQPYDLIWPRVLQYMKQSHVLFEGALVSNSYGNIGRASEPFGSDFVFAFLDTPLQVCIDRILQRRIARGNTKPFDPNKSVIRIYNSNERVCAKCIELRRRVVMLDYHNPVPQVVGLLNESTN